MQRLKLALALSVDWNLLLFDEPLTGLDIAGRQLTEGILGEWKSAGKAMVLVVHDYQWIWQICTRLLILADAQIKSDLVLSDENRTQAEREFNRLVG